MHALVSLYYTVHKGSIFLIVIFIYQMSLFYKLHGKFVLLRCTVYIQAVFLNRKSFTGEESEINNNS